MANALFEVDYGLRVGDQRWFSANGDIISTGNLTVGNIIVSGAYSVTNTNVENTTLLEATNFSTANAMITGSQTYIGGDNTGRIANIYATLADISSNVLIGQNLFIGPSASSKGLSTPTIVAIDSGSTYAQMAIINSAGTGSADYAAYSSTGTDTGGWVDMGIAGETFNDGAYTITKPNDGYLFTRPLSKSYGGNLIIATSEAGSYNDVVVAVGAFHANAEVARFHGNITSTGFLNLGYTKAATSTTSAALVVAGGVGIANGLYVNGTTYLQNASSANTHIISSDSSVGIDHLNVVSAVGNIYSVKGNFTNLSSANLVMTGDITQSTTGTFTYAANTLPPKQYVDVMAVVFGG